MQSIPGLTYFGKQVFVEDTVTDVPAPPVVTPSNDFIKLPWGNSIGTYTELIGVGKVLVFQLTVPDISTKGKYCSFAFSPTGAGDYFSRYASLSDTPLELTRKLAPAGMVQGQNGRLYFTVGGYPLDAYQREYKQYPNLSPGGTYYINIAQVDPALSCHINYSLTVVG